MTSSGAANRALLSGTIAVVTSTYNRPDALDAVLRGLSEQTDRDFAILVADDGSGPATADVVEAWRTRLAQPVEHVWHPDEGFRLAEIRNRAIEATSCRYIVFLDGDCVPSKRFVEDHRRLAEPGWFVTGSRILLGEALTRDVLAQGVPIEDWGLPHWAAMRLRGRVGRVLPLIRLPLQGWRKRNPKRRQEVRGCNLAFWRSDLIRVGGFDASFTGWGSEDWDLAVRLMRAGVGRKSGRCAAPVFHLWHKAQDRAGEADNLMRLREVESSDRIVAIRGIGSSAPVG